MNKEKLLTWAVLGLLLLNLGTLGFLFFRPGPTPPMGPPKREMMLQYLSKELAFDDQQQITMQAITREHHYKMDSLRNAMKTARRDLFANLKNGDDSGAEQIGVLQAAAEREAFRYFRALRGVANQDQLPKFDHIIQDAMRMLPPPGGRR
jgi:periplasmic protein CpxP/Spy